MECATPSRGPSFNFCGVAYLQEQNEALLAQLHARECAIRDLMLRGGASAAEFAAFAADIDSRCVCVLSRLLLLCRHTAWLELPGQACACQPHRPHAPSQIGVTLRLSLWRPRRRLLDTTTDYTVQPGDGLQHAAPDRNTFSSPQPSPRPAAAAPAACGFGSGSTPGLRRPRPRALSATPLRDSVLQRLHFSASRCVCNYSREGHSLLHELRAVTCCLDTAIITVEPIRCACNS